MRPVTGRSTSQVLLAALLAWSGLCLCFAHELAPAAAVAHDCGDAPPEAQDEPCGTSCNVREAVLWMVPDGAAAPQSDTLPVAAAGALVPLPETGPLAAERPGPAQPPASGRLFVLHRALLL